MDFKATHAFTHSEIRHVARNLGGDYFDEKCGEQLAKNLIGSQIPFAFVARLQTTMYDIQTDNPALPHNLSVLVDMAIKDCQFFPDSIPKEYAEKVYDIVRQVYG